MGRFYGNHPGTRQNRPLRRLKPATKEERLESMNRELARREQSQPNNPEFIQIHNDYIQAQRDAIAREEAR